MFIRMETIIPRITQVQAWNSEEIYLLDKDDRGYRVKDIGLFETDLEESRWFTDGLRTDLYNLDGDIPELVNERTGDILWAVRGMFRDYPDKFEEHFTRLP